METFSHSLGSFAISSRSILLSSKRRFLSRTLNVSLRGSRLGEKAMYWALDRLGVPHTRPFRYDPEKKYSENMALKKRWKASPLLLPGAGAKLALLARGAQG